MARRLEAENSPQGPVQRYITMMPPGQFLDRRRSLYPPTSLVITTATNRDNPDPDPEPSGPGTAGPIPPEPIPFPSPPTPLPVAA